MLILAGIMWFLVVGLFGWVWWRRRDRLGEVFRTAGRNSRVFIGIVPLALLAAGFLTPLVPGEVVADWLGDASGVRGMAVAILVGWCMPVPPPVFFPIVAVLLKSGAALPQLVALVVAWNVFALYRTLVIELPMMGRYFVTLRLLASLALPPLAGIIAALIVS